MIEINLIPDIKQELLKAQRVRSFVISLSILVSSVLIAIVVLLCAYIFTIQSIRSSEADKKISSENAKMASNKDLTKTLTIQNQLSKMSELYSKRNITSRIFMFLDKAASSNDVKYSDVSLDCENSEITINGQSPSGYSAVEVFRKTLASSDIKYKDSDGKDQTIPLASDINTSNTSYGTDSTGSKVLRFTISFTYTEELFSNSLDDMDIVFSYTGNVTDSYLGIPKSIFTDRAEDLEENE